MKNRRRIVSVFLVFILIFANFNQVWAAEAPEISEIEDQTQALLVANPETGQVFYSKNPKKVLGIASMTKVMTYLLVKDDISDGKYKPEDLVKIDEEVSKFATPGNSRMELKVGEQVSVDDLLKGLMVVSGNDAATALAKKSAGSVEVFSKKMNEKARELGLDDAHFINPTGLSEEKTVKNKKQIDYNKMSAVSLLKLAKHVVVKYPEVSEYGKLENLSMPERNYIGEHTHGMYKSIPGLLGLKTGYTLEAMYNFVGYVDMNLYEKGQKFKLITVVTGAETEMLREEATRSLIKYVNDNYKYMDILDYDLQFPVVDYEARDTKAGVFPLYLEKPVEGIFPKGANPEITYETFEDKKAPYEDGEILGKVIVKYENEELGQVNLINKGYKAKLNFFSRMIQSLKDLVRKLMLIF